ncbi:hypothetical protein TNCV_2062071 [Trichonephila clavipes]|nr:hypothetical protein TNCV_2062071 [Trichonephila clavipes]
MGGSNFNGSPKNLPLAWDRKPFGMTGGRLFITDYQRIQSEDPFALLVARSSSINFPKTNPLPPLNGVPNRKIGEEEDLLRFPPAT